MTGLRPPEELLEQAARRLEETHPGLRVRFAEAIGRRVSHVAGTASDTPGELVRIEVPGGLAAYLSGRLPEDMPGLLVELSELLDSRPRHG